MSKFEEYFRRADLDKDGRISGAEAVAFFQASNLPKPTLAQIWQHADQNRTGFLGRQEFFNALKLVTVAQSKRELTPDIVKAALYGPASSKIPAPQINPAALPPAQPNATGPRPPTQQPGIVNSMAPRPPTQQPGVVNPMQTQNIDIRSQGPPNSMAPPSAQYFAPQGNQSMRSPPQSGPLPSQGVGGPSFQAGGGLAGPGLSNSNVSGGWLGGRGVGATVPKPQEPLSSSSFTASRPSVGGTGIASSPMFGGDLFSASSSSSMPTQTASIPPVSSASVPATSAPQTPAKIDPLGALNAFTRQPTVAPVQSAGPSAPRPNQQGPTQNAKFGYQEQVPNTERTQVSNTSLPQWPKMTRAGVNKYMNVFMEVDSDRDGKITGDQARSLFLSWKLPREILKQVWDLSDQDNDSMLSLREFCIALYLMERYREGQNLPPTLPSNVLLDETLLSLTGPPNPSYRPAGWGANPGSAPQQPGMPGGQQMSHANMRPPMPGAQPMQYNQPKGPMPSMDNSHAHQLSNGDQNTSRSVALETTEAEKVVEDKKEILDSREKMAFYRNKMQDLVLYKSRCDNRLNEITERAIADKREAEMLAKKYEEKYKQVAEVASKLTIEEASFRDIQERKMELNQALVKMDQGGSADGILQVRADRIQSDLEELLKALTERCKKHGIDVKSTAVIELPKGWQPGVPEISAVWDEDWDKFEDEGFSFDATVPANTNPTSQAENSATMDDVSEDSYSNADRKKPFETESAYAHSEDESAKSPADSPTAEKIFESPTKEDSFNHFGKSFDADTERGFDDQGWGTFDNNDDVDSVWGFNSDTAKDAEHEKHGESYFFDSNSFTASPRKSDSPQGNNSFFQKKSPFGFDDSVPGSPASRAGTSPRYSGGGAENSFFDNFSRYDSFSATDRGSPKQETFSRFDSMSSSTQDNNFSRFDSMSSTTQDRSFARFDSMSSNAGFDQGHTYSFDDSDPFGSSGPFKVSSETQTGKNETGKWAF
uniref:Epidermal growth factor receptor substrate 15-like 1 n=1 Tax=Tanacetum cinerariifolium TaxID=118510 RepID=A0A6L2KLV3_TANCI|nr:epidermal growth factor receptor substrate 15-like 1 [Tanacetum cinerariifolium]